MKAQELRLGNLVYDTGGKVNTINMDAFKYLLSYGDTDICQVKPIPLTEEWLVKFDGKKILYSEIKDYSFGDYSVTIIKDVFKFWVVDSIDSPLCIEIKYVHQLQNLYFALTGEELTIK